jgi:hypothetical protein
LKAKGTILDFRKANSYLNPPLLPKKVLLHFILIVSIAITHGQAEMAAVKVDTIPQIAADSLKQIPDSTNMAMDSSALPKKQLYEYIANPMLQVVTWPLQNIFAPGLKLVLYPTKAPLRYLLNENVIDRTIRLISFGNDDKIMLYPTLNLAPGTGSFTGLTLRHKALFGRPTESLVTKGSLYVNGDWRMRSYIIASKMLNTDFTSKSSLLLTRVKNSSVNQPGLNQFWYFADTSNVFSFTLYHKMVEKLGVKSSVIYRDNHYGDAPVQKDSLASDFFRNDLGDFDLKFRGLNQAWQDRIVTFGVFRDSRNNDKIPLVGNTFNANYHHHFTTANHDFHAWEGNWTGYYKLGTEKYEISSEEERKSGKMSLRKLLQKMEYDKLKREIFNRKVLVLHAYVAQSYELANNSMPVYGLQTLGNDTPMRGYSGSRFRDYSVASWGAEYRFPIMRLVDGVMFNEFGVYGRSWDKIDVLDNVKNSWGFGIRARRPDLYLFRAQLGFHGLHGIQLNMSVDEPY